MDTVHSGASPFPVALSQYTHGHMSTAKPTLIASLDFLPFRCATAESAQSASRCR